MVVLSPTRDFHGRDVAYRDATVLPVASLVCWGVFGNHEGDTRLIVLGATGVVASLLVLTRASLPRTPRVSATHFVDVS